MKVRLQEKLSLITPAAIFTAVFMRPEFAFASVEASLQAIQSRLITTILPMIAILGLVFAGISLASGNQNAKQHFGLALGGAAIGFGAPSLIQFIRGMIV